MGFFSSLIGLAGGALRAFTGAPSASAAQTGAQTVLAIPSTAAAAGAIAGRAAFVGPPAPLSSGAGRRIQPRDLGLTPTAASRAALAARGVGCPRGGNGRVIKQTVVQSLDADTGELICENTLRGAPAIMQRDLAITKRTIRVAARLGRKFIRRTRVQSKRQQLLDVVESKAIERAILDGCPGNNTSHT